MTDAVLAHDVLRECLDNSSLAWGLAACGIAQLSKLLIELIVHRRWRPAVLIETGGMPSSHSALATGTSACIGWTLGFDHPLFALAAMVSFVVMYDASGIRRAAGVTAERVNALPDGLWDSSYDKPLKESLIQNVSSDKPTILRTFTFSIGSCHHIKTIFWSNPLVYLFQVNTFTLKNWL